MSPFAPGAPGAPGAPAFASAFFAFLSARFAILSACAAFFATLTALTAFGAPKAGASIEAQSSAATDRATVNVMRRRERMGSSLSVERREDPAWVP